jgi:hypothetical protein
MVDVLVYVSRNKRVKAVCCENTKLAWPNSQGIGLRCFKQHWRFWWRLNCFKDGLKLKIVRENQNADKEVFDFFSELP